MTVDESDHDRGRSSACIAVIHEEVAEKGRKADLEVVMNRRIKFEHARIFGGLNTKEKNASVVIRAAASPRGIGVTRNGRA